MKVLQIGKFFPPPCGGIETVLTTLVDQLKDQVQIDVLVANVRPRFESFQGDGFAVYKVPSLGRVAATSICPTMPWHVSRLHQQKQYDIVHLHFPNPMAHAASYVIGSRVPLVITWHSDIIRQRRTLAWYRPALNHILRRASAVVAATPKHFSSSTQLDPSQDRQFVVPFGMDYSRFALTPEVQERVAVIRREQQVQRLVFAVGRHVYYKGFAYLIRALAQLRDTTLLLGGDGPLTGELKALAEQLGLGRRVVFRGRLSDAELLAHYHAADVFCMPSVEPSEAFGMVQLEAMACRKPVVCCELNNGVTYVNQHGVTGLVVPPRDPAALAAALSRLTTDQVLRRRMGQAAHQRATTVFTLDRMREGTLDVYRQVLSPDAATEPAPLRRAA